jgi:hypothetical protein
LPEPQQVTIADVMRAYAADAVKHAKRQYGFDLDYSEASLEQIDRMLDDRMQGKVIEPDKLTSEQQEDLWVYCKMIGGYVGEVVIRNLGGTWQTKEIDSGSSSVKLMAAGKIEGSPPDSVWRTFTEPFRSMVSYYRSLRAILGHGGERTEQGVRMIKVPALSPAPPESERREKPWWKFW